MCKIYQCKPGSGREFPQLRGSIFEGDFGDLCKTQRRRLGPSAKLVRAFHQHVDAVGADEANHESGDQTKGETGVQEGQWHSQDARSQTALQQVNQCVRITENKQMIIIILKLIKPFLKA